MQENISQTLAGRAAYLHSLPCSLSELKKAKLLKGYENQIFNGNYPEPIYKTIEAVDWYPNYINTYVERDVRQLKNITDLEQFKKFLRLCAGRCGQILNLQSLGNDCVLMLKQCKLGCIYYNRAILFICLSLTTITLIKGQ